MKTRNDVDLTLRMLGKNRICVRAFEAGVILALILLSVPFGFAHVSSRLVIGLPRDLPHPPTGWGASHPLHLFSEFALPTPRGLSPSQIWHAYDLDRLPCAFTGSFGDSSLCGAGQVIAIVDAFDDPNIANDLAVFSEQFNLPPCTTTNGCFVKVAPQGTPDPDDGWALEISLDVEWAHAVAPGASILLVEAKSNDFTDLLEAVRYASSRSGVHQVSMSWGGPEFSGETAYNAYFQAAGISFFASSGDEGYGVIWPSVSPYVVAVGGTTLNVDSAGNVLAEIAWHGSGGGLSDYEAEPLYQVAHQSLGYRGVPDVSYDADPRTGFPVYDSFGIRGRSGWFQVGGTSAGAPQWAAISAIINSERGSPLSSVQYQTVRSLYDAAVMNYPANYRAITVGSNGECGYLCTARPGYNFVTGLGSPRVENLATAL